MVTSEDRKAGLLSDAMASAVGGALGALGGVGVVGIALASAAWSGSALLTNPFVWGSGLAIPVFGLVGATSLAATRRAVGMGARVSAMDSVFQRTLEAQRLLLPDIQDGLVLCDTAGRVLAVNYALERMSGRTGETLLGLRIEDVLPGLGDPGGGAARWRRTSRGEVLGDAWYLDAQHADGGVFQVEVTFAHVADARGHRVLYAIRDISEEAALTTEMERQARLLADARHDAGQAHRARAAFYKGVSHELLTPLTAVIGYGDLVLDALEEGEVDGVAKDVRRIVDSGQQLRQLIQGVLDLARIEAGQEQAFLEWFKVRPLVDEVVAAMAGVAASSQNELVVDCEVESLHVHLDRAKIANILHVLLANALRVTERGRVRLGVRIDKEARTLVFRVEDPGEGVALVHRHKVFEVFPELGLDNPRVGGAHSVALALAYQQAGLMGGRLALDDIDPALGCAFVLEVPVDAATQDPLAGDFEDDDDELDASEEARPMLLLDTPALATERAAYAPKRSVTGEWVQPALTKQELDDAVERELARILGEPGDAPAAVSVPAPPQASVNAPTTVPPDARASSVEPAQERLRRPTLAPVEAPAAATPMAGARPTDRPMRMSKAPALAPRPAARRSRSRHRRTLLQQRLSIPPEVTPIPPAHGAVERGRMVVVEPMTESREALAQRLAADGWWVTTGTSAPELMHLARSQKPDVLYIDIVDGIQDLQDLRRLPHHASVVGVPMVWSHAAERGSLQLRVDDIVVGPVDRSSLRDVLSRFPPPIGGKLLLIQGEGAPELTRTAAERAGWTVCVPEDLDETGGATFDLVLFELYSREFCALNCVLELQDNPTWNGRPVVAMVPSVFDASNAEALRTWLAGPGRERSVLPVRPEEALAALAPAPAGAR